MPTSFHEVQFPTNIGYNSVGGPEFSTEIIEMSSGFEKRNQNWELPRERWNVAYGVLDAESLRDLVSFFYARRGKAYGFRFKNHDDYSAADQEIGEGDGSTATFQLIKKYTSGGETLNRKISKPVAGTVHIYIDSIEQIANWTINTATGVVTLGTPPASGEVIIADFEFDVPVRFDTDYLPVNLESYQARSANVPIVEIKL